MEVKRFVVAACAFALLIGASRHEAHLLPRFTSVVPLPPGYPPPPAPDSNPLTAEKIELGRRLFYDKRLSANGTQSCGSCHQQRFAFCDGRAHAIGSTGEEHTLNTMSLVNVAYRTPLTWSNRSVTTLEQQALIPLTNGHPVEMGMAGRLDELPARLADYAPMFEDAFPGETISVKNIAHAIASFERSIVSADSPHDRLVHRGDTRALSAEAWRGLQLFNARCSGCHGGLDFASGPASTKFRIPTLRNVALTSPYLHDGSIATLKDVIDAYAEGRRAPDVKAFAASPEERRALVAFLESLTDESVTTNPRFSDPAPSPLQRQHHLHQLQ